MSRKDLSLDEHLRQEHRISPFQTYLKEIVYGGNDGIVTTFAVVAGFAGAKLASLPEYSFLTVLLFGLANLFADGVSMGLGNVLSIRSEQDVYKAEQEKELQEIRTHPDMEKKETTEILIQKGFTKQDAKQITDLYAKNETYWLSFMMNYELEMPNPTHENPLLTGLATFVSFVVFGFIPLIPFLMQQNPNTAFFISCIATTCALIALGILRWKVTTETLLRSVSEVVLVGGTAAIIAYIVGTFFTL